MNAKLISLSFLSIQLAHSKHSVSAKFHQIPSLSPPYIEIHGLKKFPLYFGQRTSLLQLGMLCREKESVSPKEHMVRRMRETLNSSSEELVSWKKGASQRSWSWPQEGTCPPQDREAGNSSNEETALLVLKEEATQKKAESGSPDHGKRRSMRMGWSPD